MLNLTLDKMKEECGVFGIVSKSHEVGKMIFYGLYALQHRGQESAGIATFNYDHLNIHKEMGLVSHIFNDKILKGLNGQIGIGHTRYSTTGNSSLMNAQPVIIRSKQGPIAFAHNGNLVNTEEIVEFLEKDHYKIDATSDSYAMAQLIGYYLDNNYDYAEAAQKALSQCNGAYSIVMASGDTLIGARCLNAIRPLSIGILDNTDYIIASETVAFDLLGAKYLRDLKPGEIFITKKNGSCHSVFIDGEPREKLCVFELIYFSRPDSIMYGHTNYSYRLKFGEMLAEKSPVDADLVISVPDSGTPAAIGYSNKSGIPYAEGLVKNRYVGRTFIEPTQEMRELGIKLKLNPMRDILEDKRIVVVDDSIVRGTTTKKLIQLLKQIGAREVHVRISSPPVIGACYYGIDTNNRAELIASNHSIKEMQEFIGADSLEFLSKEDMFAAIGMSNDSFCSACLDLNYLVPMKDHDSNQIVKV